MFLQPSTDNVFMIIKNHFWCKTIKYYVWKRARYIVKVRKIQQICRTFTRLICHYFVGIPAIKKLCYLKARDQFRQLI